MNSLLLWFEIAVGAASLYLCARYYVEASRRPAKARRDRR